MAFFNGTKKELEATRQELEAAERRIRNLEADFKAIEAAVAGKLSCVPTTCQLFQRKASLSGLLF